VGQMLQVRWATFAGMAQWREIQSQVVLPRSREASAYLRRQPGLPREIADWLDGYQSNLEAVSDAITAHYQDRDAERAASIQRAAADADGEWGRAPNLSRTAVRALRSTAGVTCVLVGMRRMDYVEEVVAEIEAPVLAGQRDDAWSRLADALP